MEIKITLEDEALCEGCPLNTYNSLACRGGFKRELGKLVENDVQGMMGDHRRIINCLPVRPMACRLANEHALVAIAAVPAKLEAPAEDRRDG